MEEMLTYYDTYRNQEAEVSKGICTLPSRTAASIFQRFRKVIAPSVARIYSLMERTPQNAAEEKPLYWDRLVKTYAATEGHHFVFRDCFELLV